MWAERMSAKRWIWEELRIAAVLQSTGNISTNSTSSVLVGLLLFQSIFSFCYYGWNFQGLCGELTATTLVGKGEEGRGLGTSPTRL